MTAPIKGCPQPDPPELVMRADGYHYQEDDMSNTRRELTDEQLNKELGRYAFAVGVSLNQARHIARAAIAAHVSLNAPADRDVMRAPEGWKWVPIDPTPMMIASMATVESSGKINKVPTLGMSGAEDAYEAMLAAAPTPPAEQQGEQEPAALLVRRTKVDTIGNFVGYAEPELAFV